MDYPERPERSYEEGELRRTFAGVLEIIASNVHDMWARQRRADGWTYGPRRDDAAKKHPGLVPYEQLPESEREYDRLTAVETLKSLLSQGYAITRPTDFTCRSDVAVKAHQASLPADAPRDRHSPVEATEETAASRATDQSEIPEAGGGKLRQLLSFYRTTPPEDRWRNLQQTHSMVERLLEFNEPLLAFDFASEALGVHSRDKRLRQLQGVSLARSGAVLKANEVFRQLEKEGHTDEETLGNLARSYKSLWEQAPTPAEQAKYLRLAFEAYRRSYEATGGYWSGINVAFLALMRDDDRTAHRIASQVRRQCSEELESSNREPHQSYWLIATIAETWLIEQETELAITWYQRASDVAGRKFGNITSTRRQARRIAGKLRISWSRLIDCFPVPHVVVFEPTSSVADSLNPHQDNLPKLADSNSSAAENELRESLSPLLRKHPYVVAYATIRSWHEIVFLERVVEQGGDIVIIQDSDTDQTGAQLPDELAKRRDLLVSQCSKLHRVTAHRGMHHRLADAYLRQIVIGLAAMRAVTLETSPQVLTLKKQRNTSQDGASDRASKDRSLSGKKASSSLQTLELEVVSFSAETLENLPGGVVGSPAGASPWSRSTSPCSSLISSAPRLMALLFADIKGFSQLHEKQLISFAREFFGDVASFINSRSARPLTRHTWGDGLFLTFDQIGEAGLFALDLAQMIESRDWPEVGLPSDLNIRIGLHAGPVYECFDPISEQRTFVGVHVNHAARIEPITPPGNVYASEAFAALATAQKIAEFHCEYVGRTPLAKDFGLFSTYHLRR